MNGDLLRGLLIAAALGFSAHAEAQSAAPAQPAIPSAPDAPAGRTTPGTAQTAVPEAAPAAAPPPPASESVYIGPMQAPPLAAGPACVPPCREGYACDAAGRCVTACSPPCGSGERCTSSGACEPLPLAAAVPAHDAHRHEGFLFRASSGFSFGNLRVNAPRGDAREDGALFLGLTLDAGAAVIPNLIVRGRIWGDVFGLRESDFGEQMAGLAGGLGAGVDYYFMPVNIRVGATLGVAGITLVDVEDPDDDRPGRTRRSKAGLGVDFDVAKEWWVSSRWGLGVGLRLRFISVPPERIGAPNDGRLSSFQGGLNFNVTFN